MTSLSDDSRRNNPGILKGYRSRLIRRAEAVAEDPAFRTQVRQARQQWNEKYPSIRIQSFETWDEWADSDAMEMLHSDTEDVWGSVMSGLPEAGVRSADIPPYVTLLIAAVAVPDRL